MDDISWAMMVGVVCLIIMSGVLHRAIRNKEVKVHDMAAAQFVIGTSSISAIALTFILVFRIVG